MSQFRNLVFEGGGIKGAAYAGALSVLEDKGILPDIRRVAGTSAGAVTAALLATGATSGDLRRILGETDFGQLMDDSWWLLPNVIRMLRRFGWYKGRAFAKWMKRLLRTSAGKGARLTFRRLAELAAQTPATPRRYRELYVVALNLTRQSPLVLSAETTPDMPVWLAVRMSMSIPLVFASVRHAGEVIVDGGVTWNYPIDLFDQARYLSNGDDPGTHTAVDYPTRRDDGHVYNKETLGFRVDTADEIKAGKDAALAPPRRVECLADYLRVLIGFVIDSANKAHLHENDWHRTVFLDAEGVGAGDLDLSDEQSALVDSGRRFTGEYFKWFEDPAADPAPLNRLQ